MGLLGRNFASKLRSISKLAVAKIDILKKKHQARASYARSDAAELLNLGFHDQALLRVEHLIKEQNILDVFVMIESYCKFLSQRADLLERNKDCPSELKEATSSLIYVCSRSGELPELQKMREIFTSKFGKEFAAQAVELYKNNGVNSVMIQKLSGKGAALEIRLKVLKNIADEIGITLHLKKENAMINVNKLNLDQGQEELESRKSSSADDFTLKVNKNSNHRATLDKVHLEKNSSSESDEVMPKKNYGSNTKESEEREATTLYEKPEPHLSQNPRDNTNSLVDTELASSDKDMQEDTKRQSDKHDEYTFPRTSSLVYMKTTQSNGHLNDSRTQLPHISPRRNLHRSQADSVVYLPEERTAMESAHGKSFLKQKYQQQEQVNRKVMSARTR